MPAQSGLAVSIRPLRNAILQVPLPHKSYSLSAGTLAVKTFQTPHAGSQHETVLRSAPVRHVSDAFFLYRQHRM